MPEIKQRHKETAERNWSYLTEIDKEKHIPKKESFWLISINDPNTFANNHQTFLLY